MLDSINTGRIVDALDRLTHEVRTLHYEIGHLREMADLRRKLSPPLGWFFLVIPACVIVFALAIGMIAAATRERAPSDEKPRNETHVELPDPAPR
jgi:hypothetical protein